MSLTLHRPISSAPEASSISISTRRSKRTGKVLIEVRSPLDMVEWLARAVHVLGNLGHALSSDLRWAERDKATDKLRKEHDKRKKLLTKAYMDYRLAGHKHRDSLTLLAHDPRFAYLHWDRAIFSQVLPREAEVRPKIKQLLKRSKKA